VGGNAFDHRDDAGILVHKYGPHIFHTQSKDVFDYLSQFNAVAELRTSRSRLRGRETGTIPINLDTVNILRGLSKRLPKVRMTGRFFAMLSR